MNQGVFFVFVFSLPVAQKPGMDVADGYVTFVRHSQDMLRDKVNEEVYIERLFDVSKMPSPPLPQGRGPTEMWQNNRADRDKSHFETRKRSAAWQTRLL